MSHGLGSAAILEEELDYTLVYELGVGHTRELPLGVGHSPLSQSPVECAHTDVMWPRIGNARPEKNRRQLMRFALARSMRLVEGHCSLPSLDDL
jgi:hypothetical protein